MNFTRIYGFEPSQAMLAVYNDACIRMGVPSRVLPTGHRAIGSRAELRAVLREAGLPKGAAEKVAAAGWPALCPDSERAERLRAATESIRKLRL